MSDCPSCEVNRDRGDTYWAELEAERRRFDGLIAELRELIKPPADPYPDADRRRTPLLYEFQRGWAAANEEVATFIDRYDTEAP